MQKNVEPKIVLTGGHAATPGLAVAQEIKNRSPKVNLSWIGAKYQRPGSNSKTLEYEVLPEIGVKFYPLLVGKLQTKFTRYTIPLLFAIPLSFVHALFLVLKIKPQLVLSFGGFSSFPVVFWASIFGIPVILHEQTVAAGRAAILSATFSKKIALARESSIKFFPRKKCVVTGNPILKSIIDLPPKNKKGSPLTLFVVGGSRGSEFINESLMPEAKNILEKYRIIQITGQSNYRDVADFRKTLPEALQRKYKLYAEIDPRDIHKIYEESDIIVSRSGANTVSEIMMIKRPAVLIPLPRTYMKEQVQNARYAEDYGIAKVMSEEEVSHEGLTSTIESLSKNWEEIVKRTQRKARVDTGATERIVDLIFQYLK